MELTSFKEILLKKSVGNKNLQILIEYMGEENLVSHVVEALEKMARPTHNTGSRVNGPTLAYAANLDRSDVAQIRDAMSHHVSHYKAALKAHHAATDPLEKAKFRRIADQHLDHLIPTMHLAAKMKPHSHGKIDMDYVELPAWETNYTTIDRRPETGKFKHDTKKLGRRPSPGASKWGDSDKPESRGVPDYHYLEMPPHHAHEHYEKMPHEGGYPWEEVQIGSPAEIDAGKAYLHIEDVADKKEYTPHPFDFHPINARSGGDRTHDVNADHFSPDSLNKFAEDLAGWKSSEHHKRWQDMQRSAYQADPEGYKKRGTVKPSHVYEGIPLQEQLGHVHQWPKREKRASAAERTAAPIAPKPTTPKPAAAATTKPHPLEGTYQHWKSLPDSHPMKSVFTKSPEFVAYVKSKEGQ